MVLFPYTEKRKVGILVCSTDYQPAGGGSSVYDVEVPLKLPVIKPIHD